MIPSVPTVAPTAPSAHHIRPRTLFVLCHSTGQAARTAAALKCEGFPVRMASAHVVAVELAPQVLAALAIEVEARRTRRQEAGQC